MQLREYIDKNRVALGPFAARIGVAYYTLQRYLSGSRFPGRREIMEIHKATNGAVQPNDFYGVSKKARKA